MSSLKEISSKLGTNQNTAYDVLNRIEGILSAQEERAKKAEQGRLREYEKQIEANKKKQSTGGTGSGVTYSSPSGILSGAGFGIGAAAAGLGGLAKGAGALGAGLGAFFVGLAAAEGIMEKFGDGENLKNLLTNLAEGLGAFSNDSLLALGALFAGGALFGLVPGGAKGNMLGIAALGAGLAAFFVEFSAADALIQKYGGDGSSITTVVKNIGDVVSTLVSNGSAAVFGSLFATGAILGALTPGVTTTAKSAIGIAAVGAGIATFFTALAAGDIAISQMQADGQAISSVVTSIGDIVSKLIDSGTGEAFAGLFATGAIFGALASPVTGIKATLGIGLIGAGIAAFFTGLASGDVAISAMGATGESFKAIATNVADGISAFTGASGAAILGLIGTGALFGPAMIGASVGMGAIGAGIGFFFTGLAAGDAMITALSSLGGGSPGEGFKNLLINTADGVERFANIDVDPNKVSGLASALNSVSLAMVGFFGADAFGKMKSIFDAGVEGVADVIDFFFGSNIAGRVSEGPIERIVKGMKPLQDLEMADIDKMDKFADGLDRFFESFNKIATSNVTNSFANNIATMVTDIGFALEAIPALINGGPLTNGSENWLSKALGTNRGVIANFGEGLEALREEDLNKLKTGVDALYEALGIRISAEDISPLSQAIDRAASQINQAVDASQTQVNVGGNNNTIIPSQPRVEDYYDRRR